MHTEIEKIKKSSKLALVIAALTAAVISFLFLRSYYLLIQQSGGIEKAAPYYLFLALNSVFLVGVILLCFNAFKLLYSIQKNTTPFTKENVKRLKAMACTVILLEVWEILWGAVSNSWFYANPENKIHFVNSMGGLLILVGVLLYCVALVFEYGILLQQQADETL